MSSGKNDSKGSFTALPEELVLQVIKDLSNADLKSCRLLARQFSEVAASLLFHRIVLVPSKGSLVGMFNILMTTSAWKYVREVVYDNRYQGLLAYDEIYSASKENLTAASSIHFSAKRRILDVSIAYCILTQPIFLEVHLLSQICRVLRQLRRVEIYERDDGINDDISLDTAPYFVWQSFQSRSKLWNDRIPNEPSSKKPHRATSIFLALTVAGVVVPEILMDNVPSNPMMKLGLRSNPTTRALATSRKLDLQFQLSDPKNLKDTILSLSNMLLHAPDLEDLHISHFNRLPTGCPRAVSHIFEVLSNAGTACHSGLKALRTTNMVVDDLHFPQFLKKLSSLESLNMSNTFLTDVNTTPGEVCCWVKMMKFFHTELHLKRMRFDGSLKNHRHQRWYIADRSKIMQEDSLRDKVERFCTSGGICPLEKCAVPARETFEITRSEAHQLAVKTFQYDDSWKFWY